MSTTGDLLHKGAEGLRKQAAVIEDLRQKIAAKEDLMSAVALVETCVKSGRLQESPEPIIKRAEALLAEGQFEALKKQAETGGIHIDPSLIGDLKVDHQPQSSSVKEGMVEIDPNNELHSWLFDNQ